MFVYLMIIMCIIFNSFLQNYINQLFPEDSIYSPYYEIKK